MCGALPLRLAHIYRMPRSARPFLERLQYTEPEMQDTDLVFEDFLHGRAEKFFADIDDEALAPP